MLGKDPKLIRKPCPGPTPTAKLGRLRCKSFPACMLGAVRLARLIYSRANGYKPKPISPRESATHTGTSPEGTRPRQQRDDGGRLTGLPDCGLAPAFSIPEQSHLPRAVPAAAGLLGELPTRPTGAGNAAPRLARAAQLSASGGK